MSGDPEAIAAELLERAVGVDGGAEIEASVDANQVALTRFANSVIHQNVADDTIRAQLRLHRDGRTASGSTTRVDDEGIAALVERTFASVAVAPLDPGWPGLAPPAASGDVAAVDPATATVTPQHRAEVVASFVDAVGELEAAGYCRSTHSRRALANSAGQAITSESAEIAVDGIARSTDADGVARAASGHLSDVDGGALGARAAAKARGGANPVELPPDRYEVVLEPSAVADVLMFLGWYGFNAKAVEERVSFVRLGEAQFDAAVTLVDDAPAAGEAFDADGTPTRRTTLIDAGTARSLTHDLRTAAVVGAESTGHGVGAPSFGALARHLCLVPSDGGQSVVAEVDGPIVDATTAELVAGVERGILVTDLWYTRVLDPRTLVVTGLTRNGVWLIERGEVVQPLRNFRFTQSYAQALMPGSVRRLGGVAHAIPGDTYAATAPRWMAPAMHLASWNFTGGASG